VFKLRFDTTERRIHLRLVEWRVQQDTDYFTMSGNTITVCWQDDNFIRQTGCDVLRIGICYGCHRIQDIQGHDEQDVLQTYQQNRNNKINDDMTAGTQTNRSRTVCITNTQCGKHMPGVVFVDKERIEYFTKSGNTLGQLRRGTLGTGIKGHRIRHGSGRCVWYSNYPLRGHSVHQHLHR
jgi:hypothetical protein